MPHADHAALIDRYQRASAALAVQIDRTWGMTLRFGIAYLAEHFYDDTRHELILWDIFDDARADLSAELLEEGPIDHEDGYYKLDALGRPAFFKDHERATR
jgi:hypothetical protein